MRVRVPSSSPPVLQEVLRGCFCLKSCGISVVSAWHSLLIHCSSQAPHWGKPLLLCVASKQHHSSRHPLGLLLKLPVWSLLVAPFSVYLNRSVVESGWGTDPGSLSFAHAHLGSPNRGTQGQLIPPGSTWLPSRRPLHSSWE